MRSSLATTIACLAASTALTGAGPVSLTANGKPAVVGDYAFPSAVDTVVFQNDFVKMTFEHSGSTMLLTSAIMNGTELVKGATGNSWYVDSGGGTASLVCDTVKIIRVTPTLVEAAWADTHSPTLQHEHHMIMTADTAGLYGYNIMTAAQATSISEVRFNTRWNRCIFDHSYNWERGHDSQQPTYAYLDTQVKVQDETWRVDGKSNPSLACPTDNEGRLSSGLVYTKYMWCLYHHENPMFGHYGSQDGQLSTLFGVWFTPLGGVTHQTSAAYYGAGPQHQDLAIHQDAIILNYFGVNHFGEPGYNLKKGYKRLYGPWLTYFTSSSDTANPDAMIATAAAVARANINASIPYLAVVSDPLYSTARTTVTGTVVIADGRPADSLWVLMSTEGMDSVYSIHEPTFFVKADAAGSFSLPGIPPGTYSLYFFSSKGSITGQYRQDNVVVPSTSGTLALGSITWKPVFYRQFLWQIGAADREGGEFHLGNHTRQWELPGLIPGDLTFTIGSSHEPSDWYYAQTQGGTWTVAFNLPSVPSGTAVLTVSASMTDADSPSPAVNGVTSGISGAMPKGTDSTLNRQTVRSGYPRLSELTFPTSMLKAGLNTITFTRPKAAGNNTGMGWDTILLEVDPGDDDAVSAAVLSPVLTRTGPASWRADVSNALGAGEANCARVEAVRILPLGSGSPAAATVSVRGRSLSRFAVPLGAVAPGETASVEVVVEAVSADLDGPFAIEVDVSANGGRARVTTRAEYHSGGAQALLV